MELLLFNESSMSKLLLEMIDKECKIVILGMNEINIE